MSEKILMPFQLAQAQGGIDKGGNRQNLTQDLTAGLNETPHFKDYHRKRIFCSVTAKEFLLEKIKECRIDEHASVCPTQAHHYGLDGTDVNLPWFNLERLRCSRHSTD